MPQMVVVDVVCRVKVCGFGHSNTRRTYDWRRLRSRRLQDPGLAVVVGSPLVVIRRASAGLDHSSPRRRD